jgi:hypothetical protein
VPESACTGSNRYQTVPQQPKPGGWILPTSYTDWDTSHPFLGRKKAAGNTPSLNTNIHMTEVYYSLPFTSYRQKFILFAQILLVVALKNIHYGI